MSGRIKPIRSQAYLESRQIDKQFFNSSAWETTRKIVLNRDCYLCQTCLKNNIVQPANQVDHITPRKALARNKWLDASECQTLCVVCHSAKTIAGG